MDDAVRIRTAAREALSDIEPTRLREVLANRLADASMLPGVLALLSARAIDPGVDTDRLAERAAGVQLIYEGLRLTRALGHAEPWTDLEDGDTDADMDILAADVFVSRGFYLLARTEAAAAAVGTVRSFGRDQTYRRAASTDREREALDRTLEADVFELAVVAGTTAASGEPSDELLDYASTLARDYDGGFPSAGIDLPAETESRIAALSADRVASSPTDP
ncbi:DUF7114 family protein [Haloferacaceae archaeon DSL9]